MRRPLLITDCDEVLLHMVTPFAGWLDEAHDILFDPGGADFTALHRRGDGARLAGDEVWPLLDSFFASEMHRQPIVPGAVAALERIAEVADVVVLTNLGEQCRTGRIGQLESHGIRHRVECNSGGKGARVVELLAEYGPSACVFVDDLGFHHASVKAAAPQVARLHMIAEPALAARTPPAPEADARIDDWSDAVPWILARLDA